MSFYPTIARNILLPLGDAVMRTSVSGKLRFLEKSQGWKREELADYQNRRLRELIKHVHENVPYYREVFRERKLSLDDIRTVEDLAKLPIISKKIIRDNFEKFLAHGARKWKPVQHRTGGTTGESFFSYISRDSWSMQWACDYRAMGWAGYRYGDRMVTLAGSSLVPGVAAPLSKRIRFRLERNTHLSAVHLSEELMGEYTTALKRIEPSYLRGYPSAIASFSRFLMEAGIEIRGIKGVFTTAEMLHPWQRELIEEAFQCKTFSHYGCPETGAKANECGQQNGLHLSPERSVTEIVDSRNINNGSQVPIESLPHGESGELMVTDLVNYAMPFIRYVPGDIGSLSDDGDCPCGRGLPLLKELQGRTTDIITFSNGITLAGPALTLIFKDHDVLKYQVIQDSKDSVVIKLVRGPDFGKKNEGEILEVMRYHCGESVDVTMECVEEIPLPRSSKHRYIVSMLEE